MAAGLGFKDFTTGEVLTAADVDGYLMQGIWVFASNAARDAAVTAPAEGNFAFTKDTNSLWYYDGAAWVSSGATGDIEGVTAGVGISGGGTSGTVTVTNSMATEIAASGDIIVGTGSGTFDNLPIGTTGQILTADTTVSPYKVKWATPASSGGMTLLSTTTLTGASVSLSGITSSYKALVIYVKGFQPATNNATMQMRFNGQTATRYENRLFSNSTVACTPTATSINVMPAATNGSEGLRSQSQIVLPQYSVSSYDIRKMAIINSTSETGPDFWNQLNNVGYFYRDSNGAITSIDLFPSTGNFTDGTILLYGVS